MRCNVLDCDQYTRNADGFCQNHRKVAGGGDASGESDVNEAIRVEKTGVGAAKVWTSGGSEILLNAKGTVADQLANIFAEGAALPEPEKKPEPKGAVAKEKPRLNTEESFVSRGMLIQSDEAARKQTTRFVKALPANPKPAFIVGDGTKGHTETHLNKPYGVAFVPAYPSLMVMTTKGSHQVRVYDQSKAGDDQIRESRMTADVGFLFCVGGLEKKHSGHDDGEFNEPWGVAVTVDSKQVLVVDKDNDRIQVRALQPDSHPPLQLIAASFQHLALVYAD
jgi:hypothetical protein